MTLDELRKEINQIDLKILSLIKERAEKVIEVGEIKKNMNTQIYIPEREKQIFEMLKLKNKEFGVYIVDEALISIFTEIISACRNFERPVIISFLGPEASYTHHAAIKKFGTSAKFESEKSIPDIFDKVEKNMSDYGVVPIENSTEGAVNYTLDMFINSNLKIVSEIETPISHYLMSCENDISKLKKIYSHPQTFGQCKNWIFENLRGIELIEASSNSSAAQKASCEKGAGAIASKIAASKYELNILAESIEDYSNNTTRFLVIGKNEVKPSGHDKTSIMFSPISEGAGSLYKSLEIFYKSNINLTMIESRPDKKSSWNYIFFLDLEGHISDEKIKNALDELKAISKNFKILGSYPKNV